MKKLLLLGILILSFIISYAKPLPFYTLRYKGKILDTHRQSSMYITFEFDKSEVINEDLINAISEGGFSLYNSKVEYKFYPKLMGKYNNTILPSGFTITKETYDIK